LAEAAITAHGDHEAHAHHHPNLQHHFDSLEQQHEAATLGMWMFLITEVLFFGGLFLAYMLYRVWYPEAWAEGSYQLNLTLGTINTVVLIGSSLTMAFAVRSAQTGLRRATVVWLILTMVLGLVFLTWALRSFVVQPFNIPSGSMLPTLYIGDYLIVAKWPYGYSRFSFPGGIPSTTG